MKTINLPFQIASELQTEENKTKAYQIQIPQNPKSSYIKKDMIPSEKHIQMAADFSL